MEVSVNVGYFGPHISSEKNLIKELEEMAQMMIRFVCQLCELSGTIRKNYKQYRRRQSRPPLKQSI